MNLERKVEILVELGRYFNASIQSEEIIQNSNVSKNIKDLKNAIDIAHHSNGWFTKESVSQAIKAWAESLTEPKIRKWLSDYSFKEADQSVGVIMAGNIPFVGLHDALCVLLSGYRLKAKLSSKDSLLMTNVLETLQMIAPEWNKNIELNVQLKDIDYLIATGTDNSARYFDYYFKDVNRVIRKNRTSVAIIQKEESKENLDYLAEDVFSHYGMGCRNVTKVYIPKGFKLDRLFNSFFKYQEIINHNKYGNNYDYNKAVYLLNKIDLIENGFLLLKEDENLHSPVGVLFYEYYESELELSLKLNLVKDQIQCKVASLNGDEFTPFGKAQSPELWNYADGVDTLAFLN